jgi:hypothetical protein
LPPQFCLLLLDRINLSSGFTIFRSDWVSSATEINGTHPKLLVDNINKYSAKETKAGGKLVDVNDTGSKFAAGGNDTGGNLPPVLTTPATNLPPVANNGNNIRLLRT